MTEQQVQAANQDQPENRESPAGDQISSTPPRKKKKASWFRTILWMVSMMLLVNVIMAIIFYVLYHFKILQ